MEMRSQVGQVTIGLNHIRSHVPWMRGRISDPFDPGTSATAYSSGQMSFHLQPLGHRKVYILAVNDFDALRNQTFDLINDFTGPSRHLNASSGWNDAKCTLVVAAF